MDALSDILRSIRLRGSVYFRSDFCAPWGMEIAQSEHARFHIIVRGRCNIRHQGMPEPLLLAAGDIVAFPFGDAHWLADKPEHPRKPGAEVLQAIRARQEVFGGEGVATTIVCGHFEFERDFEHPFIAALPRMILIEGNSRHQRSWLETAANVLVQETGSGEPGSDVVVDRLAEVLFIQVLRLYAEQQGNDTGFLAALSNSHIARALQLIHAQPEHDWALENLAHSVGMSRSTFAARFREMVGLSPMAYLTDWRMHKARQLLRTTALPLGEIAELIGYTSDAAFHKAFKRKYNLAPGRMRKHSVST